MYKRTFIALFSSFVALSAMAGDNKTNVIKSEELINPTYINNVYEDNGWEHDWFVDAAIGSNSFLGSPVGCSDFFQRMELTGQLGIGKWFLPSIGGRVVWNFGTFYNSQKERIGYDNVHADFLWNVVQQFNKTGRTYDWAVSPFLGIGMMHNREIGNHHPFAFSYGVNARYSLDYNLDLTLELGNSTTFADFDGYGSSKRFGDNLLNLSVGLSYKFGLGERKRIVNAQPYIDFYNKYMSGRIAEGNDSNKNNTYSYDPNAKNNEDGYEKNNYSGLNSLLARLSKGNNEKALPLNTPDLESDSTLSSPIHLFFKLNSTQLTEASRQKVNLDEVVATAKRYNLNVIVTGSADSKTGSRNRNRYLGKARAKYIGKQLLKRGLDKSRIKMRSLGGVDTYDPYFANRQAMIELVPMEVRE